MEAKCEEGYTKCMSTFSCYSDSQRCDGFKNCEDASDEYDCPSMNFAALINSKEDTMCLNPFNFQCKDGNRCIDGNRVCENNLEYCKNDKSECGMFL